METLSTEIITTLQYLMPGFVSAWIFYGLTPYPKPSQFERVVQALILTLFVQVFVSTLKYTFLLVGRCWALGEWSDSLSLAYSLIFAILLGLVLSYCANSDKLHKFLRSRRITKKTSYPSEWSYAFSRETTYVVLHLRDERRLHGWLSGWPDNPNEGHFSLVQPSWLEDRAFKGIEGVESILVEARDVKWVEFLEKEKEKENDEECP